MAFTTELTPRRLPFRSNNALIYPALGLATVLSKATRMTDYMIMSGARALASLSPALEDPDDSLLPDGLSLSCSLSLVMTDGRGGL